MRSRTTLAILFGALGIGVVLLVRSVSEDSATVAPARTTTKETTSRAPAPPALPGLAPKETPRGGIASFDCTRPSGAAARVDGVALPLADLCTRLSAAGAVMQHGTDRTQARLVLDRMIDATVVRKALAQKGIAVDPKALGTSTGLLREQLLERLELQALAEVAPVTEAEIDAELANGAPGVDRGEGIEVEGWLLRVAANDVAGGAAAQKRMTELVRSPDTLSAKQGVTPIPRFVVGAGSVEPDLEAAAGGLAVGKWSAPVKTSVGWAVIRVVRTVDGMSLSDPAMRARVRRALEARRLADKRVLEELRAAARVEIIVDV